MGLPVLRYVFAVATVVMLAIGPLASAASVGDIDTLKMKSPSLTRSLEAVLNTEARRLRGLGAADADEEERLSFSLSSIKNALGVKKTPPEVKQAQEAIKLAEAKAELEMKYMQTRKAFIAKMSKEEAFKQAQEAIKLAKAEAKLKEKMQQRERFIVDTFKQADKYVSTTRKVTNMAQRTIALKKMNRIFNKMWKDEAFEKEVFQALKNARVNPDTFSNALRAWHGPM